MFKKQIILSLLVALTAWGCGAQSTPATGNGAESAVVSEITGKVEFKQPEQTSFSPAANDVVLQVNGQVQTGEDGRVRLNLSSGTIIRVASSSLFTLTSNEETEGGLITKIKLEFGKIFIILNGGVADVETPSGVAAVRGSYLKSEYNPDTGELTPTCLEGNCSVTTPDGKTTEFTGGEKITVRQDANKNWVLDKGPMSDEDFQEWLEYNPEAKDLVAAAGGGSDKNNSKDGAKLILIPAGEFTMGTSDKGNWAASYPQHQVYLDQYWIYQTEVTNGMYQQCVAEKGCVSPRWTHAPNDNSPYYDDSRFANFPKVFVGWNDAKSYCSWANAKLPTEAQWEKAARSDDLRLYPWGNQEPDCNLSNYLGCKGNTVSVASYPNGASYYGVLDMAGNVSEWVFDFKSLYPSSPQNNPSVSSETIDGHVVRGGSWLDARGSGLQTFARRSAKNDPQKNIVDELNNVGFRCVVDP